MSNRLYSTNFFITLNPNLQFRGGEASIGYKKHIDDLKELTDEIFNNENWDNLFNGDVDNIRNVEIYKAVEMSTVKMHPHIHVLLVVHKKGAGRIMLNYGYIRETGKEWNAEHGRVNANDEGKNMHMLNKLIPDQDVPIVIEYIRKGQSSKVWKNVK